MKHFFLIFCFFLPVISAYNVKFSSIRRYPISRLSTSSNKETESILQRKLSAPFLIPKYRITQKPLFSFVKLLFASLVSFLISPIKAYATTNINGWDLYGRVPHDDWLFRTKALMDSNLLKRSIVESVSNFLFIQFIIFILFLWTRLQMNYP